MTKPFLYLWTVVLVFAVDQTPPAHDIEVYFSPNGGCAEAVAREIGAAQKDIQIQAYSFTSRPIAEALLNARRRGVRIRAILDKSNRTDHYSAATFLANEGCEVCIDDRHQIAHSKIMIIDESVIITGSFNFTNAAEKSNAENLLVIRNHSDLVKDYLANWENHRRHSDPYQGLATTQPVPTTRPASGSGANGQTTDDVVVYVTRRGKHYHRADCSSARNAVAVPLAEAKRSGKGPCGKCKPPQ